MVVNDHPSEERAFSLDDAILMEYIGMNDKNGEKIYDGDIVKTLSGKIGQIAYHDLRAGYIFMDKNAYNEMLYQKLPIEIIGNIHENSGLL